MKYLLCLLSSILFFSSCEKKYFYSEYQSVNVKNWKSTDTLKYLVDIEDVNSLYDISISVRHQKEYEFSNLWLNVIDTYSSVKETFRLEVPLFKNTGKPYGESSGSLCTQTIKFQKNIRFPKKGKYEIKIVQLMRKEPLIGIADVGIIIETKK